MNIERIRELLANLTGLTSEELAELDTLCEEAMGSFEEAEATPEIIAQMNEVVEAAESSATESTRRDEESAAAQQQAEELRSRFKTVKGQTSEDGETETETETPAETETETPAAGGETGETDTPEAVAASGGVPNRAARMAQLNGRPGANTPEARPVALIASGAGRGGRARVGEELDKEGFAQLMSDTLNSMSRSGPARGEVILASADYRDRFPDERRLDSDAMKNGMKIHAITKTGPGQRAALTASGGVCSPVNIDWSVDVFAVADTPLVNGLTDFQADRGGLTFVPPPDIGALAGATTVWTEAQDAGAPGNGLTKPVLSIQCGSPTTVLVDAVPTRLGFGNEMGRFSPEWVSANTELAMAAAAKVRELNLLTKIDAASALVNSFALLGTARDLLATLDQVVAYYRDVHRLSDSQGLTAIFPRWAKDAFRADIARELAHDIDDINPFGISDAQVDAWFAARNVTVIWMLDGRPIKTTGASAYQYPAQFYTKVVTGNPIQPWINKTVWNLFVDGTFSRLDSGTLDIGVVRDSTLDATNDYEIFSEVFEGVAFRGVEALTIISPVLPNGASAGTIATSSYTGA